jgi:hypothetical protein
MDLDLDLDYLSQLPKDTKRHPALADIFTLKRVMRCVEKQFSLFYSSFDGSAGFPCRPQKFFVFPQFFSYFRALDFVILTRAMRLLHQFRMTLCSKFYRDEGCCDLIQNLLISEHDYTSLVKNVTSSPFGHEINAEKVKSEVLERLSARLNLLGSVRTVGLIANSKLFIQTTISLFKKLRLVENFYLYATSSV